MRLTRHLIGLIVVAGLAALAANAPGATRTWTGSGDPQDWYDSNNWDPAGDPDPSDELLVLTGPVETTSGPDIASDGSITVDGAATFAWLPQIRVGTAGAGTLTVRNEAMLWAEVQIGCESLAQGVVTLQGAGTYVWFQSTLSVGDLGYGRLEILDGADASSDTADIGRSDESAEGLVTVNGQASRWTSDAGTQLQVGGYGTGTLQILNGGEVLTTCGRITDHWALGGQSRVTVDGADSAWTLRGNLDVEAEEIGAQATLEVLNGGLVSVGNAMQVGLEDLSAGTLDVTNGTVSVGETLTVGQLGQATLVGGVIDGDVDNQGLWAGSGQINGDFSNSGTVAPGTSAGSVNIDGNYTQGPGARLDIEIGGSSSSGNFDRLTVTETAALDGTLAIALLGGFQPSYGDVYQILTFASGSGTFATVTGRDLPGDWKFNVLYNDTDVTLLVAIPGDANVDRCVDGLDYNQWSLHYQAAGGWTQANFNSDAVVDGLDYNIWSLNYEAGCAGADIPEPAFAGPLILGLWAVARRRQYQRSQP